ncbi:MAG TPA: long-chain-fatty-acid--CoA ligase [Desulfitobacteriaceae bacterium]|nr:long-chain-fatty-acid--CoA ligase [Desulfitobacteriaceae bacterium]
MTIGEVLTMSTSKFPEKEAVIYKDKRFTYKMLDERANRLANALLKLGLKKGDRCAVLFYNRSEWAEIYFGLARTGIITVPVNFRLTAPEIEYILNNSEPKALIYEEDFASTIEQVKKNVSVEHYICVSNDKASDYEDCLAKADSQPPNIRVEETDPILLAYTSGTTGFPKGAVVTHRNLATHLLIFFKEYGNVNYRDTMLVIMPIFHSNATWFLLGLIMVGGTAVIYPSGGFNPEEVLELINTEKITFSSVVPTMLTMINNLAEDCRQKYDVSSLRMFLVGSAPLLTKTKEDTIAYFKRAELFEGYGSTETGLITILNPQDQLRKQRSIGFPAIGKQIRLLDNDGNEVEQGEVGELFTKGWGILIDEYWRNPQASKEAFRGEWISPGDMARKDEEGFLYLVDRKKDMIITGGENLYPTEVENILVKHPAVLEAVVIGLPDELWGERVHAVIVPQPGMAVTGEELKDFVKPQLAGYKRPKSYDFVKELPKNATGKILRRKVRELY